MNRILIVLAAGMLLLTIWSPSPEISLALCAVSLSCIGAAFWVDYLIQKAVERSHHE